MYEIWTYQGVEVVQFIGGCPHGLAQLSLWVQGIFIHSRHLLL